MKIEQVNKKKQKLKLALQGDTSTGKTLSSLLIAHKITSQWRKIVVIDTEQQSSSLYNSLGPFNTLEISAPLSVNKYIQAIQLCEEAAMEVIIIDSISSEWVGEGGIIDIYCSIEGDHAAKWNAAIPGHNAFIGYLQGSSAHIIVTVRTTNTQVQQEDGYAHHFTTVLELNKEHEANIIKDRTGIFKGLCPTILSPDIGAKLAKLCNEGESVIPQALQEKIDACKSHSQLHKLMITANLEDMGIMEAFSKRRLELDGLNGKGNFQNDKYEYC